MVDQLLDSFKIEPLVLLLNGILFLLLVQVLDKLFWKPVLRHLEGRREGIASAYKKVDDTRREMENLRTQYQQSLSQIEADARGRIQQTVRDAQKQREEMIAKARAESDAMVRQGSETLERDREELLVQMQDRFDEAAEIAVEKSMGVPANPGQRKLIMDYIAQNVLRS